MFDSPPTTPAGIGEHLAANGAGQEIGYLELPPNAASIKGMRFELIRRKTRHAALVVATRVTGESLAPINAQFSMRRSGRPHCLVAGAHHALLAARAEARSGEGRQCSWPRAHRNPLMSLRRRCEMRAVALQQRRSWSSRPARAGGNRLPSAPADWWDGSRPSPPQRTTQAAQIRCDTRLQPAEHELGIWVDRAAGARSRTHPRRASHPAPGREFGCASDMTLFLRAADPAMAEHMQNCCSEGYPADSSSSRSAPFRAKAATSPNTARRCSRWRRQSALSCGERSLARQRECSGHRSHRARGWQVDRADRG